MMKLLRENRLISRLYRFQLSACGLLFQRKLRKKSKIAELDFDGGIHAVEHAMIAMSPIFAMCDRWDIGGLSTPLHPDTGNPPFSFMMALKAESESQKPSTKNKALMEKTLQLIENCECKEGCPSCIYSPKCGNENKPLDKKAAGIILQRILRW